MRLCILRKDDGSVLLINLARISFIKIQADGSCRVYKEAAALKRYAKHRKIAR
jgi:hypothetical protein